MSLGVWLPLALADLRLYLELLVQGRCRHSVAEILRTWCLPELAAAHEETVKGVEDDNLMESIFKLERDYGS